MKSSKLNRKTRSKSDQNPKPRGAQFSESVKSGLKIRAGKSVTNEKSNGRKDNDDRAIDKNLNLGHLSSADSESAAWEQKGKPTFAGSGTSLSDNKD